MRIAMLLLIYLTNFAMFGLLFFWLPVALASRRKGEGLPIGSSAQAFAGQFKDVARATPGRRVAPGNFPPRLPQIRT